MSKREEKPKKEWKLIPKALPPSKKPKKGSIYDGILLEFDKSSEKSVKVEFPGKTKKTLNASLISRRNQLLKEGKISKIKVATREDGVYLFRAKED